MIFHYGSSLIVVLCMSQSSTWLYFKIRSSLSTIVPLHRNCCPEVLPTCSYHAPIQPQCRVVYHATLATTNQACAVAASRKGKYAGEDAFNPAAGSVLLLLRWSRLLSMSPSLSFWLCLASRPTLFTAAEMTDASCCLDVATEAVHHVARSSRSP